MTFYWFHQSHLQWMVVTFSDILLIGSWMLKPSMTFYWFHQSHWQLSGCNLQWHSIDFTYHIHLHWHSIDFTNHIGSWVFVTFSDILLISPITFAVDGCNLQWHSIDFTNHSLAVECSWVVVTFNDILLISPITLEVEWLKPSVTFYWFHQSHWQLSGWNLQCL